MLHFREETKRSEKRKAAPKCSLSKVCFRFCLSVHTYVFEQITDFIRDWFEGVFKFFFSTISVPDERNLLTVYSIKYDISDLFVVCVQGKFHEVVEVCAVRSRIN